MVAMVAPKVFFVCMVDTTKYRPQQMLVALALALA